MKTLNHNKLQYVLGKCLGQPLAWVLRKQQRLVNWLMAKGLSAKLAKLVLAAINLLILAIFLLIILPSWIVLSIAILTFFAYFGVDIDFLQSEPEPEEPELRNGLDGFGYYDNNLNARIDCGSSEDDE